MAKLIERIKAYGFKNYEGGGGPSEEVADANTKALGKVLEEDGHLVEYTTLGKVLGPGVVDEADEGTVLIVVNGKDIGYDRWGFTSNNGEVDQDSANVAYEYLIK